MTQLTAFTIRGLNDEFDLEVSLRGRHAIIVGPNGSGKSTALQVLAYAMGRQWSSLAEQRFSEVELHFGETKARLSRKACRDMRRLEGPARYMRALDQLERLGLLSSFALIDVENLETVRSFEFLGLTTDELKRVQRLVGPGLNRTAGDKERNAFNATLDELRVPKTFFMPTSRRIEVELAKLTSNLPDYLRDHLKGRISPPASAPFYEEVVRFGMDDIEALLAGFERRIQEESRNRFNRMMSLLIKEMANAKEISIKELQQKNITEAEIDRVLKRIEEGVLSPDESVKIRSIVTSMTMPQKGGGTPHFHRKWLAHFFVRLREVDEELMTIEAPIVRLVDALNRYLRPKAAQYDIESYDFSINTSVTPGSKEIKLRELSSGEKQLVSLLAMLELAEASLNVFIDEPELSLSVPWQYTILEDMAQTEQCKQLIAVTHSPFVFDNSLKDYVIDFTDCMVR